MSVLIIAEHNNQQFESCHFACGNGCRQIG